MLRILEGLGDGNLREHLGEEVRVDLRPAWNPAMCLVIVTKNPTPAPAWCRFTFCQLRPWVRPAWHRGDIGTFGLNALNLRCHQLTNLFESPRLARPLVETYFHD